MFANYKCPNGLPPSECRHIPQLINNTFSFFTRLVSKDKDKTMSDERTRSHREELRAQERSSVQQRRSPPAVQQNRERSRSR